MGSISGAFALASFIGGLLCRRPRAAVIVGAAFALFYALLVLIGLWNLLADANLAYLLGALAGVCLVILAAAVLGWCLRRGAARVFIRSPSGSRTQQ
jgi:hypothetical protein